MLDWVLQGQAELNSHNPAINKMVRDAIWNKNCYDTWVAVIFVEKYKTKIAIAVTK